MRYDEYRQWSIRAADWAHEYFQTLRERKVRASVSPGEAVSEIPKNAPEKPESMETIFSDFRKIIPEGLTHWQHPRFFAYFCANAAPASMIAEQLASVTAAQCMLWQTSPIATELEILMVEWLRNALGLPKHFSGVIQDSASSSTLAAILTMRERALAFSGNGKGLSGLGILRIYATDQAHSSLEKAVRIAGIGSDNLVQVKTDRKLSMSPEALESAIAKDCSNGLVPAGIVAVVGGTAVGASDSLRSILGIAKRHGIYSHVDAAWAGSAMICPEFRKIWDGIELADSIVFNPHKWLGAQLDCSVQFLADPSGQVQTLSVQPNYLKTLEHSDVTDFSEWGIQLSRRFRALKTLVPDASLWS